MIFDILTLFPEMIEGFINDSILKRAIQKGLIEVNVIDFREYSTNKHHTVDDTAYGGGPGMLISVEPIHRALVSIPNYVKAHKILTSPSGKVLKQKKCEKLSKLDHIIIICGHYEGFDERLLNYIDEEISIGDYVLTGGEAAAVVLIDAISRLIPDVINEDSKNQESFTSGLLDYPQYTKPAIYDGYNVPDILLSGHHANINKWRHYEALKKTYLKRKDLLYHKKLTKDEIKMLDEIKFEQEKKSL